MESKKRKEKREKGKEKSLSRGTRGLATEGTEGRGKREEGKGKRDEIRGLTLRRYQQDRHSQCRQNTQATLTSQSHS